MMIMDSTRQEWFLLASMLIFLQTIQTLENWICAWVLNHIKSKWADKYIIYTITRFH